MGLFRRKKDRELAKLSDAVAVSFDRVREDTRSISSWLHYFWQFCHHHQHRQSKVERTVDELAERFPDEAQFRREIAKIVAHEIAEERRTRHGHVEELKAKLKALEAQLAAVHAERPRIPALPAREPHAPVGRVEQPRLQVKMRRALTKGSKHYLKSVLVNLVSKWGRMSAVQLRDMVVDEQGLCSKSTFYRLLDELETEGALVMASKGREKIYLLPRGKVYAPTET